jgi:hypothetical protein
VKNENNRKGDESDSSNARHTLAGRMLVNERRNSGEEGGNISYGFHKSNGVT